MWATEWKMEDALEVRAKEAREDALEEAKVEMAEKMLAEGLDVNTISRISGLSVDTILRLRR
jgi:predicted transposase/invertase (TIGR01784 family)